MNIKSMYMNMKNMKNMKAIMGYKAKFFIIFKL
jgi:hypothetical protein